MEKRIAICPIGPIRKEILEFVAERISRRCNIGCWIVTETENPRYAYDKGRCQYNAKTILEHLLAHCPKDALRFIGLTYVDLYIPVLKYVFGLSQIEGRCAVISLCRLCLEFYKKPPCDALLLSRLEKTVIHELGHSFGLTHCQDRRCVMYSSSRIENTDFKDAGFCPTCEELFHWRLHQWTHKKTP